jgi:hypothetical protein
MDMTYAFLKHFYGEKDESVSFVLNLIEYAPHSDPDWDPFAIVHEVRSSSKHATADIDGVQVPGADVDGELESCVRPVGY